MFKKIRSLFTRNEKGVVLIELAVTAPVLVLLVFGGVEVARYILSHQKVSRLASATADISSQGQTITEGQLQNIFIATDHVSGSLDFTNRGHLIISSVSRTGNNAPFVDWQRVHGAPLPGDTSSRIGIQSGNATLPPDITLQSGQGVIIAEVYYDHETFLFDELLPDSLVYKTAYYRPRFGALKEVLPDQPAP